MRSCFPPTIDHRYATEWRYQNFFFQFYVRIKSANIKTTKVVIIGAGAAGLSAAVKLLENGIDVTVLEAESRIGGRIRTEHFADGNIDLGANFCEGKRGNVVYEMVKDLDLISDVEPPFRILTSNKKKIDKCVIKAAECIFDVINEWDDTSENMTKGIVFTKKYEKAVFQKFPNDVAKQNEALSLINIFKHWIMVDDGTTDWNDALASNNFENCEGSQYLLWKDKGYKIFLDVLMKKYPNNTKNFNIDSKIQTDKIVEKILWHGKKVTIHCEGGDEVEADYVIFTPSLGVLKAKHMSLFSPALPEKKVKSIETTGFGIVGVLHVHFPEIWWPQNTFSVNSRVQLLWVDEDNESIGEDKSWMKDISEISTLEGNPKVLQMWITGNNIETFETIDESVLIEAIDDVMKTFFDNTTNIVKADKIARSDWLTNPNFRGTYSYETPDSIKIKDPSSVESLIGPLINQGKPVVMFAGEATHPHYYCTVHGAVETGRREANRIMDYINNRN